MRSFNPPLTKKEGGYAPKFMFPVGLFVDHHGSIYITDSYNHRVKKFNLETGELSTVVGSSSYSTDTRGSSAKMSYPYAVSVDRSGDIFIADTDNHVVRRIDSRGNLLTISAHRKSNLTYGVVLDDKLRYPAGVVTDSQGNLIIADTYNNRILKVPELGSGLVQSLAGSREGKLQDGLKDHASFWRPCGLAIDGNDNVYVADRSNNAVRKVTPNGEVTTILKGNSPGDVGGTKIKISSPNSVAVDALGNVLVADTANHTIKKVSPEGEVAIIAGSNCRGYSDSTASEALLNYPMGVAVGPDGTIYIADTYNHVVRKVTKDGLVSTLV